MAPPPLPIGADPKDAEHLRLLAIFHYIVAGIGALFACMPLIHVGLGILMLTYPDTINHNQKGAPPPAWAGYLFVVLGSFFVLLGWSMAFCTFLSGRYLAHRRRRMFSFVVAAILCMFVPFGTVLGVFTLIVLSKESVQKLYAETPSRV